MAAKGYPGCAAGVDTTLDEDDMQLLMRALEWERSHNTPWFWQGHARRMEELWRAGLARRAGRAFVEGRSVRVYWLSSGGRALGVMVRDSRQPPLGARCARCGVRDATVVDDLCPHCLAGDMLPPVRQQVTEWADMDPEIVKWLPRETPAWELRIIPRPSSVPGWAAR